MKESIMLALEMIVVYLITIFVVGIPLGLFLLGVWKLFKNQKS